MKTFHYEDALVEYQKYYPHYPFFKTWLPPEKFLEAEFDGEGNISISREDDGIYGIALGSNPVIPDAWRNFSMDSRGIKNLPKACEVRAEWDSYYAQTISEEEVEPTELSDEIISDFLTSHAPDSSVFPGNTETIRWVDIHREGKLMAVAAISRWQSGHLVISSVATHTDYRGQGIGAELMKKCLIAAENSGALEVSLGVRHENNAAIRLYASSGFTLMHNFTYCERR